ncbi:hypothetical protein [Actinomadura rifamycini]|uniref:hypothetical protein n=1 Tax=Actinomadura rifamycini TaxID=31962 RepID=UPI00047A541A|nr:hypothetical protein [Actinomadura rifamycini]
MKFDLVDTPHFSPSTAQDDQPPTLRDLTAELSAGVEKAADQLDAALGELAALTFRHTRPESATAPPPDDFRPARFSGDRKRETPA